MAGPWITDLERSVVDDMMQNGWDNYEYVHKFESSFAEWHDRKYCLMTTCCTHAIHLLLIALKIDEHSEAQLRECLSKISDGLESVQKQKVPLNEVSDKEAMDEFVNIKIGEPSRMGSKQNIVASIK